MILGSQKYQNTSRTITGLINPIFTSDVLIYCDTSAGAVALELLEIPSDFWNTTYKLYVIDISNNASVNNITINAPVGFQVNNASNFVINSNGGICLIRIVSNTDYSVECNYGAGGLAVLNEGVLLTPNATSMDFVGSYVNATNVGSAVSVLIQPNIISLTYAQLLTNINNSTLVAGQMYSITNAKFIQTTGETAQIFLTATSVNTISSSGQGYFLNADYQGIGVYTGVSGYVSQLGIWNGTLVPVIGSVVIWNNFHYVNISGNNSQPDTNPLDWTQLSKTLTTGYIAEVCGIYYDVNNNNIIQRSDLRENVIQNNISTYISLGTESFQFFQWGSDNCISNNVSSESAIKNSNNAQLVSSNFVTGGSLLKIETSGSSGVISATILSNVITENSKVLFNNDISSPNFSYNEVSEVSTLTISKLADPFIEGVIAVNKFIQSTLNVAPCSSSSTIYSNSIKGVIGTIINDLGSFSFNEIVSSTSYTFTLANTGDLLTQAVFNENQIAYSNISISNLGIIRENIIESSNVTIVVNSSTKQIINNSFNSFQFTIQQNDSLVTLNNFYDGTFSVNILNSLNFRGIKGIVSVVSVGNFGFSIGTGIVENGITTTSIQLDLNDLTIYDPITFTLTIPAELEYLSGEVILTNATGITTINKIQGGLNQSLGAMRFINQSGFNVIFNTQAVGIAVADEIISNLGATSYSIVERVNGSDSIFLRRLGGVLGVEQVYIYI